MAFAGRRIHRRGSVAKAALRDIDAEAWSSALAGQQLWAPVAASSALLAKSNESLRCPVQGDVASATYFQVQLSRLALAVYWWMHRLGAAIHVGNLDRLIDRHTLVPTELKQEIATSSGTSECIHG